ncbi:MAG: hypothetical protein Kilf2KO_09350 [Rhodospirillales bacterium]
MTVFRREARAHLGFRAAAIGATFGLAVLLGQTAPVSAQTTPPLNTACSVPEGEDAADIVRRVERRLSGNWSLAVRTLRQTISRQQRLGQDSAPAEAYLKTLECLQAEVESGQHNAFLTATGNKPRPGGGSAPAAPATTTQAATTQASAPQVPVAPTVSPAATPQTGAAAAAAAANPAPSTPADLLASIPTTPPPTPQTTATTLPAAPVLAGTAVGQGGGISSPSISRGSILPGTAASYGLAGESLTTGAAPAVRSVSQGTVVPPPPPPTPVATAPAPAPAPAQTALPAVTQPVAPAAATETAAVPTLGAGDPRYVGKACLYFTRPELEVIRGRVYTNRYPSGQRVCHAGSLYVCDGGLWSGQGSCPAGSDTDSSKLEAKPRR